jgi:hypothetical protein
MGTCCKLALGTAFVDCVDVINIIYSPLNEIRVQLHIREKKIMAEGST